MPDQNPIFVVGVFRSGTSLLCTLLNQHPKIGLMFEFDVWNFPRPLLNLRFRRNWAERLEFYNQSLSRHRLIPKNDYRGLEQIRTPLDLYRKIGERKGAVVSGEKSPFYCNRLKQLHKQYPNAYFIILWRPPVEVYRSVLKAGQKSRFFGKPGMLSRMIYQQEQLIRQTDDIESKGARVFRVDYASLVDRTETVCRETSEFLGVSFDPQMLQLNKADMSAIYSSAHHAHLRRGIIERQKYTEEFVPDGIVKKLERYRHRWELMQTEWLKISENSGQETPELMEFAYHTVAGKLWTYYDSLVRAGFEFLPLPWLRIYRLLKTWVVNPPSGSADEKTSLANDLRQHWQTILIATLMFAVIAEIHSRANPHLLFILFYAIPCGLLALVVNLRWATLFVLASSFLGPTIQFEGDVDYQSSGVFIWNFLTRLILLEAFILILGRIRLECVRMELQENIASGLVQDNTIPRALKFSIITPSFRNSEWLKLCIASVADQRGVEVEHIVQDSCSDDGTQDWLPHDSRVKAFIEKDAGMYDAVNRGYRRATGDILAYLNCDEQYLPGALAAVEEFFQQHPYVEVLLAGSIVTDGDGNYVCHRHGMVPNPNHIWFRFPALTSSIFIRRRVIEKRGIFFDTQWRDLGDFHWVKELMRRQVPMADAPIFTSVFADTGDNMNLKPNAIREKTETVAMIPFSVRLAKPLWILNHRLRRISHGHFSLKKTSYAIYTKASPARRVTIEVPHPTPIWWSRL
jgi:glycosyltransferase involved in cell wall biosynthesis